MAFIKLDPASRKAIISIDQIPECSRRGIRQGFFFLGKSLVRDANKSILKKPKSGRTYLVRVGGRIVRHRASAPGEAPANLTGKLRKSIDFLVRGSNEMEFGADTPYAKALELGAPDRNLAERPYLSRSIKDNEKNARGYFENNIRKQFNGGVN
jgi:hypothetical protein